MSIISYMDLEVYTGKTFTTTDQAFATAIIDGMSDELANILGRPLTIGSHTDVVNLVDNQSQVFLANAPVVSITDVMIAPGTPGATTIDPSTYVMHKWGFEFIDAMWSIVFVNPAATVLLPLQYTQIQVDYTAGLNAATIPAIRQVLIRACTREWIAMSQDAQNISNLHAGRMMDYVFTDKNAGGFTDMELKRLDSYRRRRVG